MHPDEKIFSAVFLVPYSQYSSRKTSTVTSKEFFLKFSGFLKDFISSHWVVSSFILA